MLTEDAIDKRQVERHEEHHWLRHQHDQRAEECLLDDDLEGAMLYLGKSAVALIASLLANTFGLAAEKDRGQRLGHDQGEHDACAEEDEEDPI